MDKAYAPGDGVVTGFGKINGRGAFAYAHDFTVFGGAAGEIQNTKIKRVTDLAYENRMPVIALYDSGGGRIQEGGDDASVIFSLTMCVIQGLFRNYRLSWDRALVPVYMLPC